MSKRRSRSQRPPKARTSEPPPQEPAVAQTRTPSPEGLPSESAASSATDELAALDAGWDNLTS
jgi:hypothetical protein